MWRNDTKHTVKVRGPDNVERVYPPGAEVPKLDHPRLQAAADNKEFTDLTPLPPPAPPKPKAKPSTIMEAVESVVEVKEEDMGEEGKKRKRKGL